jgi:hypothetical protein
MKRVLVVLAVLGALAAWPTASGAATFKGTVVAKERGKLLVASPAGLVRAVSGRAALGARVTVNAGSAKVVGRAHTAHLRGVVIRRLGATMYISSNHHVVAVRNAKTRLLSSANDTTPAPSAPAAGDVVSTTVTVTNNGLDEDETDTVGHQGSVQIQAQVVSVAAGTVTLLINGQQVPVNLPAGLTLPASLVGQTVTLTLNTDEQDGDDNDEGDDEQDGHNNDQGDDEEDDDNGDGGDDG